MKALLLLLLFIVITLLQIAKTDKILLLNIKEEILTSKKLSLPQIIFSCCIAEQVLHYLHVHCLIYQINF